MLRCCGRLRFHDLVEFDDNKRSCRKTLSAHNARRRLARALGTGAAVPQHGGEHHCSGSGSGEPREGLVPSASRQAAGCSLLGKRSRRGAAPSRSARRDPSLGVSIGEPSTSGFCEQHEDPLPLQEGLLLLQGEPLLQQQLVQQPSTMSAWPQPRPGSSGSHTVASTTLALAGISTCSRAASQPADQDLPTPPAGVQAASPGVSHHSPTEPTLPAQAAAPAAAAAAPPAAAEGLGMDVMDSVDFEEMLRWLPGLLEAPPTPKYQLGPPSLPTSARALGEHSPTLEEALGSLQLFLQQSSEEDLALRGKGGRPSSCAAALAAASRLAPSEAPSPMQLPLVRAGAAGGAEVGMAAPAQQAGLERSQGAQVFCRQQQQQGQQGGSLPGVSGMPRQQAGLLGVQFKPVACCWQVALPGMAEDLVTSPFQSSCWAPSTPLPPPLWLEQQRVLQLYPGQGQGPAWPGQPSVPAATCASQGQQPAFGWSLLPQACMTYF
ncbi:hypothetical protein N2152v2_000439 [Parachlorella kessleri]